MYRLDLPWTFPNFSPILMVFTILIWHFIVLIAYELSFAWFLLFVEELLFWDATHGQGSYLFKQYLSFSAVQKKKQ